MFEKPDARTDDVLRKTLANTGIGQRYWKLDLPNQRKHLEEVEKRYESGKNTVMFKGKGTALDRVRVASFIAKELCFLPNQFPRIDVEPKHHDGAFVYPYRVKMMDVSELISLQQRMEREEADFTTEVCRPDFFFLKELGFESPSTYTARVIIDLLSARMEQELPVVVTLDRDIDSIQNKAHISVYSEVEPYLEDVEVIRG